MRSLSATILLLTVLLFSCKGRDEVSPEATISPEKIEKFFADYPDFVPYKKDMTALYDGQDNRYLWFDEDGRNSMAEVLYNRASQIEKEGVPVPLPYKDKFAKLFSERAKADAESDLLITGMYLFYAQKVFAGLDPKKSRQLGWYLPREKVSYADYLEELMKDDDLLRGESENIPLYYNLRKGLEKYRKMKADGIAKDQQGVSIDARIKAIMVNMERCRWVPRDVAEASEYIAVNIPAYRMRYVREGKTALESDVIVGDEANKTVVFSGKMSYLVFSPYWNIPQSILEEEIRPQMEKDENYLEKKNYEWYADGKRLRQRPGGDNSLGLVKFMFPNNNNIYLHDTPEKSLFRKEDRALSHGCIRVQKARELAVMILKDDKNWTPEKIDAAMHSGEEKEYSLKRKIPVYIAYFTAVADEDGNVTFFDDVYKRDNKLARMLYSE